MLGRVLLNAQRQRYMSCSRPILDSAEKEFELFKKWQKANRNQNEDSIQCQNKDGNKRKKIVVAITGATGVAIGVRILQLLRELGVETHLVVSKWGSATMRYETNHTLETVAALADHVYSPKDVTAPISSGSFKHDGMIVAPCSMKTLAAVRAGYTEDLISRAADVCLKEHRRLLLCVRETPLSSIHLENMLALSNLGVVIFPPVPAFYTKPRSIDDIVNQTSGRILDFFGLSIDSFPRWTGISKPTIFK